MVPIGINEQNIGIAKLSGSSVKLLFPPSYAAEAMLAHTSKAGVKSLLERCMDESSHDGFGKTYPTLARWIKEEGEISFEDLETRVRAHHEGMAHLIKSPPVRENHRSSANVDYSIIQRRGDGRKGSERSRSANVVLDDSGAVEDYNCTCPQFTMEFVRGKFNDEGPLAHVACYHVNVALQEKGLSIYRFDNQLGILESIAMKVFRKTPRKTFERDKYLLRQDILTDATRQGIAGGNLSVEVIWNQKNIKGRAWNIINGIKSYFEQERYGYHFAGFALDFQDTPYEATSIVLVKGDGSGRSIHLLYDEHLGVGELPFFMLTVPKEMWLEQGFKGVVEPLAGRNPALYSAGRGTGAGYFECFDMRTQSDVIAKISQPMAPLLNQGEREEYKRILGTPVTAA